MKLQNERFSDGKYRMGYILDEFKNAAQDSWLVCTFTAIPTEDAVIKHSYSFLHILRDIPVHKLYLQDTPGEVGCYYLCEGMDFGVADIVLDIIESARKKLGVRKSHVITVGSSKGGTAALYFGLRGGYGHVISMGPQTKIATYLYKGGDRNMLGQRILDFMTGDCEKEWAYQKLDTIIFDTLAHRQDTVLHLLSSENDTLYPVHTVPLLEKLDPRSPSNDIIINNMIESHADLARFNPDFVRSRLFSIT